MNFPEIRQADILIISHSHVLFYDMENGIFATGGWKIKADLKEDNDYIKRNIGVFILIDEKIEMIQ